MFNRLTDVPKFYPFDRWSSALAMLHGFSFDRKTDGPLRVIFGRLTDGTYSTQVDRLKLKNYFMLTNLEKIFNYYSN